MDLPEPVAAAVRRLSGFNEVRVEPVGGGNIGHSAAAMSGGRKWFVKWLAPGQEEVLAAEADGLSALAAAQALLHVPQPKALHVESGALPFLITDFVEPVRWTTARHERLGEGLARLHRRTAPRFGHTRDNFIGATEQQNTSSSEWGEFFRERRLEPQRIVAERRGVWDPAWTPRWDRVLRRSEELLAHRPAPSLVHGDLWSGNVLPVVDGAALIDPAVYRGDREVDLAMAALFGGFPSSFLKAYEAEWPLPTGWEARADVYDLYHLLNHLNLFGDSYRRAVDNRILKLASSR